MTITVVSESVTVTDVDLISITDAVEDSDLGGYTREIRVYGEAASGVRPLIFTLRVNGDTSTQIAMTAPIQTF